MSALLTIAALCSGTDEQTLADTIGDIGAAALKKLATDAVNDFLAEHRQRRRDLANDRDFVTDVLRHGNKLTTEIADHTLDQLRAAMQTQY